MAAFAAVDSRAEAVLVVTLGKFRGVPQYVQDFTPRALAHYN